MKKILCLCSTVILLLLCGCEQTQKIPEVIFYINNSSCEIEYGNTNYQCQITYLTDGIDIITIEKPENLKGLTFRHADGKYTLSYNTLLCRSNDILLPEYSFPSRIIKILSELSKDRSILSFDRQENQSYYFNGNSRYGKYHIITDSEGNIQKILIDE